MHPATAKPHWLELDEIVEAFESARAAGPADLARFLPGPSHPLYRDALRELIRVDLEFGWRQGQPRRLAEYFRDYPALGNDPQAVQEIAFEEYRQRQQAGEEPSPAEYAERFQATPRAGPHGAPPVEFPQPGDQFLSFRLIRELGRGAFGRVYLARQPALADRPVALKVATDLAGEPQTLAQLQHTHIVPVYSVHYAPPFHAVCMPYFGAVTLADVLRELHGLPGLPGSGKGLVLTLHAARSVTRKDWGGEEIEGGSGFQPDGPPRPAGSLTRGLGESYAALESLTYVEAVLWIGERLADGLAHAHARGILHRDLKPANVLLTDDGVPMLLDFNLAEDTKGSGGAAAALLGGTLPYMAPEHLDAFQCHGQRPDARADLYSLGVILYELLTGRPPFPTRRGPLPEVLPLMLGDRLPPPPRLRCWNQAVSPAVESVVRHLLEPDVRRRYRSARDLHEDLQRHLRHEPLRHAPEPSRRERARKWFWRHPAVTSSSAVAAAAAVALLALAGGFVARGHQAARLEAVTAYHDFTERLRPAHYLVHHALTVDVRGQAQGAALLRDALHPYRALEEAAWHQGHLAQRLPAGQLAGLRREVGDALLLLAQVEQERAAPDGLENALALNQRAEVSFPPGEGPRPLWEQRAQLNRQLGREGEARQARVRAEASQPLTAQDHYVLGRQLALRGRFRAALDPLRAATAGDPHLFWAWFLLARCYDELARDRDALDAYGHCLGLRPEFAKPYYNRALAYLRMRNPVRAVEDLDQALRLEPDWAEPYVDRAQARKELKQFDAALDDLKRAQELGAPQARICFTRANVRARQGDAEGARRDRDRGMQMNPRDEATWLARGVARAATDPAGALADCDQALALNPRSYTALMNKAVLLSESLHRVDEAVRVLDQALGHYPDSVQARGTRGVLLARLGRRDAAHDDAAQTLERDPSPPTTYQVAGIYALTARQHSGDRDKALDLLVSALRQGYGLDLLERDPDLVPLRKDPEFRRLAEAAKALLQRPVP